MALQHRVTNIEFYIVILGEMLGLGGGVRTEERPVPVTRGYSQLDAATLRMKISFCTTYHYKSSMHKSWNSAVSVFVL